MSWLRVVLLARRHRDWQPQTPFLIAPCGTHLRDRLPMRPHNLLWVWRHSASS